MDCFHQDAAFPLLMPFSTSMLMKVGSCGRRNIGACNSMGTALSFELSAGKFARRSSATKCKADAGQGSL